MVLSAPALPRGGAYWVLAVQDNRLGIDAGRARNVFALFERLPPGVKGEGIGRYMAKKIVENAGGAPGCSARKAWALRSQFSFPNRAPALCTQRLGADSTVPGIGT